MPATFPHSSATPRTTVHVAHGEGAYDNTRRALSAVDLAAFDGQRVLLKPNAGRLAAPGTGVTTHPDVVAASIDALREAGAEAAVGESPIVGVDVHEAFAVGGIATVARRRNCPLIDLDKRPAVKVPIPDGRAIRSLKVCADVPEFDAVVSIPVMKMHMHTGATLSVKNMKGCLWRRSKTRLHRLPPIEGSDHKPIDVAIADMASVLRADLAVIDGTVGMEGLGPSAGRPVPLDAVVAGTDPFAADAVACRLMGTTAENVPHLAIGARRGYGIIDIEQIDVTPGNWREWIVPFAVPPKNLTIEFPNITVWDNGSCSACQSTLLLFLRNHREQLFDFFPSEEVVHIAIGVDQTALPEKTLCVGNCTADRRRLGIFVPGCPPVGSQIMGALSGDSALDGEAAIDDVDSNADVADPAVDD